MKKCLITITLFFNLVYCFSQTKNILVIAADDISTTSDVIYKLNSTGKFASVTLFDGRYATPTLSQLSSYDAVLVYNNMNFFAEVEMGDVIADYIDAGGGVVTGLFTISGFGGMHITSKFYTKNYNLISKTVPSDCCNGNLTLVKNNPNHPILNGVISFNGGYNSYTSQIGATVKNTSSVIASWNDNRPLVVLDDNIGQSHVKRVDLNFWPTSSDGSIDGWDASTDGALLIANSLLYVCNGLVPTFSNPGPITICQNGSYFLDPSTTTGTWSSSNPAVATVDTRGYVTGLITGTTTISLENSGGTVSASITVESNSELIITDPLAQASYKITNNPQGPIGGTINYVGYNGFNYSSQTRPINSGFYKASMQSGNEAGCPYQFYIYRCSTCGIVP